MAPSSHAPGRRPADAPPGNLWLYGRHAVTAALANPARRCRRLVALKETVAEAVALLARARAQMPGGAAETLDRHALAQLLPAGAVHQGLALLVDPLPAVALEEILARAPVAAPPQLVVALDQVTDPQNVGAILRSAAAFAAQAVILPEHGAPPVTGALAKAASGALETVPLVRVANLARTIGLLKEQGYWSVGLDEAAPESLARLDLPARIALVLGAEGSGLRRLTRERCDFLARLPTRGTPAALNVSNAAAVALYALTTRG